MVGNGKIYHRATIIFYNTSTINKNYNLITNYNNNNNNNSNNNHNNNEQFDNWWALSALVLVVGTAAGNILVCLAICWERRLQNVTNYFLMSLAITDLMVAILVMPLGILTLVRGYFPLPSIYCLAWICLDVLFCTASIMHLCTISVDRYLSLSYPMKFGRNKSRRRVTLKIIFVWLLSIAMSLPLSLMYSKDQDSLIIDGTCQIPDPLYKLIGSIVCFYIPLLVMLVTYALTVRLLAQQRQNLGTPDWTSNWMGGPNSTSFERRCTWRKLLNATKAGGKLATTPQHTHHSAASTDTELTTIDTHELWIQESEPTPCTMSALGQFGAEMLKLSRGLEAASHLNSTINNVTSSSSPPSSSSASMRSNTIFMKTNTIRICSNEKSLESLNGSHQSLILTTTTTTPSEQMSPSLWLAKRRRRASTFHQGDQRDESPKNKWQRKRGRSFHETTRTTAVSSSNEPSENTSSIVELLPPPCTCPYFGDKQHSTINNKSPTLLLEPSFPSSVSTTSTPPPQKSPSEVMVKIIPSNKLLSVSNYKMNLLDMGEKSSILVTSPLKKSLITNRNRGDATQSNNSMVTWEASRRSHRRGSSFGNTKTSILSNSPRTPLLLRRSATLRQNGNGANTLTGKNKNPSSPCLLQTYNNYNPNNLLSTSTSAITSATPSGTTLNTRSVRSHHSRNSSVISRNSSRHGRIIRLEQKATKVLGVVFFTFVILWAPFFILNLLPAFCTECDKNLNNWVIQLVTWLGYASSMVNPIFYTIFNKVFRQAFKKVLTCKYRKQTSWRPHR